MSQNYSRQSKQKPPKERRRPTEHIKTGLTAFQKTLALVGSILSIIVASITITNYLNSRHSDQEDKSPSSTIVIENNGGQGASNTNSGSNDAQTSSTASSDYQTEVINPDSSSDAASNATPDTSAPVADTTSPTSQADGTTSQTDTSQ